MKKYFLIAAVAISAIFSSCNKEVVDLKDSQSGITSFVACIDNAAVKTTLDGTKVYWNTGDEVSVNGSIFVATVDEANPSSATFTLKEGETAPAEAAEYRIYYPASAYVANQPARFKISGTQTYAGEDISGVNPMFAYATSLENTVNFKNVSGLLALQLKGTDKVMSIKVTAPSGNYLYGTISNLAYDTTTEAITYSSFTASGRGTSATLDCGKGVQLNEDEATCFYIAVPENTYASLTIAVTVESGASFTFTSNKSAEVKKSNLYQIPFTLKAEPVKIAVELFSVSEAFPSYISQYPDETSLAIAIVGEDIASFKYGLFDAEVIDEVYDEGMTIKDIVNAYGSSLASTYVTKINSDGFANIFSDLTPGTEYAFLYVATNTSTGEVTGDVRKSTKAVDYAGSLKVGSYTMTETFGTSHFENTFVVNPTTTENQFTVKNIGFEDGSTWYAVYDETAGTLTLDGTQLGYEEDGNCFGAFYYYDSAKTMIYGICCYADEDDNMGESSLVLSVNNEGIIDGILSYMLTAEVYDTSWNFLGYLNAFDSNATITYDSAAASKVSSLKPMAELNKSVERMSIEGNFDRKAATKIIKF